MVEVVTQQLYNVMVAYTTVIRCGYNQFVINL